MYISNIIVFDIFTLILNETYSII